MRNLVVSRRQFPLTHRYEAQTTVFDFKASAVQPYETVAIGMRNTGLLKTEATYQH